MQHEVGPFRLGWHRPGATLQTLNGILPSQIIPCDVECIRNMLHGCAGSGVVLDQYDVEATSTVVQSMLCEIVRCQLNQFGTFAGIYRFDRAAIGP